MTENLDSDADGTSAVSICDAMDELRRRPRDLWLDLVRADQSDRWRHGHGVKAEEYFSQAPELCDDAEESLVLICGEIQLRRESGDRPSVDEYRAHSPHLRMKSPCNSLWIESCWMEMR